MYYFKESLRVSATGVSGGAKGAAEEISCRDINWHGDTEFCAWCKSGSVWTGEQYTAIVFCSCGIYGCSGGLDGRMYTCACGSRSLLEGHFSSLEAVGQERVTQTLPNFRNALSGPKVEQLPPPNRLALRKGN